MRGVRPHEERRCVMTWALDLARQYEAKGTVAALFGIILYTDAHPNVKKVLRDEDYWRALDEVSGPKWPVFSIRALPGRLEYPSPPPGVLFEMIPVWREPAENLELIEIFEIDSTRRLPVLVVFTEENEEMLSRTVVPLTDESPNAAFSTLREVIATVADALKGVAEENLRNRAGVMTAVNYALESYRDRKRIRKGYAILKEIRDWLPF